LDQRRAGLAASHRAGLQRPVIESGDIPDGLRMPTLAAAYLNPDFQVVPVESPARIAEEGWWEQQPTRQDLQAFLLGHLTTPQAVEAPLLVLGQPGSGKSVLTRILAARLPAGDFLTIRVVLRDVPAEADLQSQIEYGVRAATGERLPWPELVADTGGALPVVLLDGFDELLQTTGVSQSDYLEQIGEFQRREAALGRPVAVVVTSRTAVADRARPVPGMVALRLEPFRSRHIEQWVQTWNQINSDYFASGRLLPLDNDSLGRHPELASQPLLLLMLAIYDADGNALQRESGKLRQSELYERLLARFAAREVTKAGAALPQRTFDHQVEQELLRLSVVAFAMFNRGRQWVTEAELDTDLAALLPASPTGPTSGVRAPLTAADIVLGRFFFIHQAEATRDATKLRSYEFLHATFGEYLIGRLISRELAALTQLADVTLPGRASQPADAFLHALLSFSPLTIRGTAIYFLNELLHSLPAAHRVALGDLLLELFRASMQARRENLYADYEPAQRSVPCRHAVYAANLLLLTVLVRGEVLGSDMFPVEDVVKPWRDLALLWRSQLTSEGFTGLITTLSLERTWNGDRREIRLTLHNDNSPEPTTDLYWTTLINPDHGTRGSTIWSHANTDYLWRVRHFVCDYGDDLPAAALDTLRRRCGPTITTIHGLWPDRAISPADALIALMLARIDTTDTRELIQAYETCLTIALHEEAFVRDTTSTTQYRALIHAQLLADHDRLPANWRTAMERDLLRADQRAHPRSIPPSNQS
jgi:hypothetical protein